MIDPNTLGHWEGDVFIFDEPRDVFGKTMKTLDFSTFVTEDPSITREDALHAVINAVHMEE